MPPAVQTIPSNGGAMPPPAVIAQPPLPTEPPVKPAANAGSVRVEHLVKSYGAARAINDVSFAVEPGTTATLLGPSGCGKTTTLRCIAGLEVPSSGRISIGNEVVVDDRPARFVAPEKRKTGMVFQSYAIWPHMTVGGNVEFPLRIAGAPRAMVKERTAEILEMVGLADFANRSAAALSGGQQQRVALARALVHRPSIVLFDEPLSNLDANLRERMRSELKLLQTRLGFTAIFVTHDQEEALALSDNVIIMRLGVIEQEGGPREVFQNPRTEFTARFLGYANIITGHVGSVRDNGIVEIRVGEAFSLNAKWRSASPPRLEDAAGVAFRADCVSIAPAGTLHGDNVFRGRIETASFLGSHIDYTATTATGQEVRISGPIDDALVRGSDIDMRVDAGKCHAFHRDS